MYFRSYHNRLPQLFSLLLAVLWSGILVIGLARMAFCETAAQTLTTLAAPRCAMCLAEHKSGIKCCCPTDKIFIGRATCCARCDDTPPPSASAFFLRDTFSTASVLRPRSACFAQHPSRTHRGLGSLAARLPTAPPPASPLVFARSITSFGEKLCLEHTESADLR